MAEKEKITHQHVEKLFADYDLGEQEMRNLGEDVIHPVVYNQLSILRELLTINLKVQSGQSELV